MHLSDLIELLQKQITLAVLTKIKGLVNGYKNSIRMGTYLIM